MLRCFSCMEELNNDPDFCPYCGYGAHEESHESVHLKPGTILNERYYVGRVLGFGGFGVTYLAWDNVLMQKVAIKEYLPKEFSTRISGSKYLSVFGNERKEQFDSGIEKFTEEAKKLMKLQDVANVVKIHNVFDENNTSYIVMEYLKGETLKQKLTQRGKLSVDEALVILVPILESLEKLHAKNLIHRDVSPDNIMITDDGKVKLLDFGAARFASSQHSKSLSVIIKPGFSPEEQYRSRGDQGPWTDVYSLAATFYKMITGIIPDIALERAVVDSLKPPSKLGIKIENHVEIALLNALNPKIEERTPSATMFLAQLNDPQTKRMEATRRFVDVGTWPKWLKIFVPSVAISLLVATLLFATGIISFDFAEWSGIAISEKEIRMPNLVNQNFEAAREQLASVDINLLIGGKDYSKEIAENKILKQERSAGIAIVKGTDISVVISAGVEKIYMPNVIGLLEKDAKEQLEKLGFILETSEIFSNTKPGYVEAQSLERGAEAESGTKVGLQISKGLEAIDPNKEVLIPDVTEKTYDEAKEILNKLGIYISKGKTQYSSTIPEDKVLSQSLKKGEKVKQGSEIVLDISLGPKMIRVVDVQYMEKDEAIKALKDLGLTATIDYEESSSVLPGKVLSQSLRAGDLTSEGSKISLVIAKASNDTSKDQTVSSEEDKPKPESKPEPKSEPKPEPSTPGTPKTVQVPNLVGSQESSAENQLRSLGLGVTKSYSSSENYGSGTVINQSHSGSVRVGETVNITISEGGSFSDWVSSLPAGVSESTHVIESGTQYRSSTKQIEETTKDAPWSLPSGYVLIDSETRYSAWGAWGAWQDAAVSGNDLVEVQTQSVQYVTGHITYHWYEHWKYWNTTYGMYYYTFHGNYGGEHNIYRETTPLPAGPVFDGQQSYVLTKGVYYYNYRNEYENTYGTKTQYRSRNRTANYYYKYYTNQSSGNYSSWSWDKPAPSDSTIVEQRTIYRYRRR